MRYDQLNDKGIHCYPLVGWDGERPGPNPNEPDPGGYCTHNMVTFPTWHRPYMLLYEVSIQAPKNLYNDLEM